MRKLFLLPLSALILSGCAQFGRPLTDAGLGALGAWAGNKVSGGDPLATAGGAAAGVLAGEGFHAWKSQSEQKAYARGVQKGRSDGIKQIYWNLQAEHRNAPAPAPEFELLVPEHSEAGVLFKETKQTIQRKE